MSLLSPSIVFPTMCVGQLQNHLVVDHKAELADHAQKLESDAQNKTKCDKHFKCSLASSDTRHIPIIVQGVNPPL